MWAVWANEGGVHRTPETAAAFADPAVRRRSIALIEQAREHDRQAADHLEAALAAET